MTTFSFKTLKNMLIEILKSLMIIYIYFKILFDVIYSSSNILFSLVSKNCTFSSVIKYFNFSTKASF